MQGAEQGLPCIALDGQLSRMYYWVEGSKGGVKTWLELRANKCMHTLTACTLAFR